jgi:hypothetical protein
VSRRNAHRKECALMCARSQSNPHALIVLQFTREVDTVSDQLTLSRPYLQVAALCEKHLEEKDGAISLIRIIDRFTVPGTDDVMPPTILSFTIVVMFKAGNFRGRAEIGIEPIQPSNTPMPEMKLTVQFRGEEEHGVNMMGLVKLQVTEEGLHWLIVKLEGEEYTRIPMRVVYQKEPTIRTS